MRCAIIHYHELALKGRNRDFFERQLIGNIRTALKDLGADTLESLRRPPSRRPSRPPQRSHRHGTARPRSSASPIFRSLAPYRSIFTARTSRN